jgi:hypothetical protein
MKVKVSKKELHECIEQAVVRALNEAKGVNEAWYDDDDEDDVVSRFLKDPKNDPKGGKKRMPGGGAAKKAAMADIQKELDAEKKDDEIVAKHDISSKPDED